MRDALVIWPLKRWRILIDHLCGGPAGIDL